MNARKAVAPVAVGALAALVSIGRLWLANPAAPTEVLWAEDGLFPLCVAKAGFASCLADPFAGYLLLMPRAVAGLVAALPATSWALATNVLAALLAGVLCAIAYAWVRRSGAGALTSAIAGLLPVMAPLVGLEAINALGSIYMPMLYVATIVVSLQSRTRPLTAPVVALVAALLLLTALTIPLTLLLAIPVVVQWLRRAVGRGTALAWLAAIAAGTVAQAVTAVGAERPRAIAIGTDSLQSYFDMLPRSLLTYWPGLIVAPYDYDVNFRIEPVTFTGVVLAGLIAVAGIALLMRRDDLGIGTGLMVLLGLAFGVVPTVIGWANNRYFVVPVLLWGAALVLAASGPVARWARSWPRRMALLAAGALLLAVWWPLMPASAWRSTPAPGWTGEVERVAARCVSDPALVERPIFSPFWPPNWGDGLSEPTHPNLPCVIGFRWQ